MKITQNQKVYWQRNLRLTLLLLGLWFVVTFVVSFYSRELNAIVILGFPLGFYMGAQGALVIYVAIIGYYAKYMNTMDREYGVKEGDD